MVCKFVLPSAMDECSSYPKESPAWAAVHFIDFGHSDWYKTKSQSAFDLHFLDYCGWWTFSATFFSSFREYSLFKWATCCFDLILEFLVYSGVFLVYWSSVRCIAGKGSLPFRGLSLHPIDSSFSCVELFSFMKSTQSLVLILGQMDSSSDTSIF